MNEYALCHNQSINLAATFFLFHGAACAHNERRVTVVESGRGCGGPKRLQPCNRYCIRSGVQENVPQPPGGMRYPYSHLMYFYSHHRLEGHWFDTNVPLPAERRTPRMRDLKTSMETWSGHANFFTGLKKLKPFGRERYIRSTN